ncbi:MAG: response regulator [Deltaproteobacteria bacterium]|nr:response regulator [Deltaproteobacteria bacterium]
MSKDKDHFKLLLVDDEEEFVKALAERLEMRDLESDTVFDGEQAIGYVEDKEPDVMVLDLKMPGIDGIEVLRQVKKAYPDIQVIILTGHGTEKDEKRARELGAFEYLEKPVDVDKLVDRIRGAYKKRLSNIAAAATFAEAGQFDTARDIYKGKDEEEE